MSWEDDAACLDSNPDLWHPEAGDARWRAQEAKAICRRCDVRLRCLADTPKWDETSIRGALTGVERKRLRKDNT